MRVVSVVFLGASLLALTPTVGSAQDEKRIHVNFGGGPTFQTGNLGERFSTGWGPAIGLTIDANPRLGFQFEYAYRWFDINDDYAGAEVNPLAVAASLSANHQTHQLDFNLVANLTRPGSPVRAYVVAGPGAYYRKVEITQYVGSGVVCDPWLYVCGSYPVSAVLGSRGGWDFGFDFGGGVGFRLGESAEFYVESRFHYVAGPDIQPTAGQSPATASATATSTGGNANGYYYPLTFGFRF